MSGSLDPGEPYAVYRIPALCRTRRGSLLAFAEARRSISDQSSNVLVLRRLVNGARVWGPVESVEHDEPASLNNPCVLATSKCVWLMYQRYPSGFNERTALPGIDAEHCCQTFLVSSVDDGKTWSAPRDLTPIVKNPGIRSDASGPGIGIELIRGAHAGRLVFPFNEGADGSWNAFAVYSDDGGKTWERGTSAPKTPGFQPNETQFVELNDGSLLMNSRNQAAGHLRLTSRSLDGGSSWTTVRAEPDLPDPVCQGAILRVSFRPDLIAFSNAADSAHRANGTVRLSRDDGQTWKTISLITAGSFEYSGLCALPGNKLGVVYETREFSPDGKEGYRIRYMTVDLEKG